VFCALLLIELLELPLFLDNSKAACIAAPTATASSGSIFKLSSF